MATNTAEIREQRANIWSQMCSIMDSAEAQGRPMSAEESQTYDRLEKDLDAKGTEIARAEAHLNRAAEFAKVDAPGAALAAVGGIPGVDKAPETETDKAYASVFSRYMRQGQAALNGQEQQLLHTGFDADLPQNAAGVGTGSAGGFTVPPAFRQKLVEAIVSFSSMRALAEVITTETGAQLPWPTADDSANEGAILAENTQVSEQDVVFGQANIDAYMYTSKLVRVSLQLLNDNAFGLESWLASRLGARIGRAQNRHFTVGTGTNQPDGIVTGAAVGVAGATGTTATITYDSIVDLIDSIDTAYIENGNVNFMMSQAARRMLRKLKDGQNRPLWEPSLQVGTPDSLLGYGLRMNNFMPAPAANAKSILFGDFREAYLIRDVQGIALMRLAERYADFLQVGFLAFARADGTVQNGAAVKAYQHSAT